MFYFTDASTFSVAFNCFFGDTRVVAISPLHTLLRPASVAPEAHAGQLVPIDFLARDPIYRTPLYWFKKVDTPSDLGSLATPQPFGPPLSPAPPALRFGRLIRRGTTSEVWEAKLGDSRLVVKYVHGQIPSAVQHLSHDRDIFAKYKPAIDEVGVGFEGLWQSEIGAVVGVGPYGGQSPEGWSDYTEEQRVQIFLKLVVVHQKIGLTHGNARPPATVITTSTSGSDLVRWVDFSAATEHAEPCGGLACPEPRKCLTSLRLSGEMLDKLRGEVEALDLIL